MTSASLVKEDRSGWPVEERLKQRIIDGDRDGLTTDLEEALAAKPALSIVNDDLLAGMKVVGDLFGSGQMQLPFVLQSAECMKAAVAYLEPHMEKSDQGGKGRIVLATVKGDVHDIGKNLVDIILTNNGYEVHNLGIKVALAEMLAKAQEVKADAIGMSGLLVKSTLIMRENLEELNSRGLAEEIPVILGGAALTRRYVERDLREVYEGRVFYGKDAFEGLHTLDKLMEMKKSGVEDPDFGRVPLGRVVVKEEKEAVELPPRSPAVETDNPVFVPPFLGSRVVKGVALDELVGYINETALFRNQWQYRPNKGENDADFKTRIRPTLRDELAKATAAGLLVPQVVYGYYPANGDGNDLVLWKDETATSEYLRFSFPRENTEPFRCIADFFRPGRVGRDRLRRLHHRQHGRQGVGGHGQAVRRGPLHRVPAAARARRGDGRGAGRVLAPAHPGGVGLRRRRTAAWSTCSSARATGAGGTPGATRPARTWRTTSRWPSCWRPTASAWP